MPSVIDGLEQRKAEITRAAQEERRNINAQIRLQRRDEVIARVDIAMQHPVGDPQALLIVDWDANEALIAMADAQVAGDAVTVNDIRAAFTRMGYVIREMRHWSGRPNFRADRQVGVTTQEAS